MSQEAVSEWLHSILMEVRCMLFNKNLSSAFTTLATLKKQGVHIQNKGWALLQENVYHYKKWPFC